MYANVSSCVCVDILYLLTFISVYIGVYLGWLCDFWGVIWANKRILCSFAGVLNKFGSWEERIQYKVELVFFIFISEQIQVAYMKNSTHTNETWCLVDKNTRACAYWDLCCSDLSVVLSPWVYFSVWKMNVSLLWACDVVLKWVLIGCGSGMPTTRLPSLLARFLWYIWFYFEKREKSAMHSVNRTEVDPEVLLLKSFIIRLKSVCLFISLHRPHNHFCAIKIKSYILHSVSEWDV